MKSNSKIGSWLACILGGVDGLAVGLVLELSRVIFERHQNEVELQRAAAGAKIGFLLHPTFDLYIPLVCIITFGAVSYGGFRFLRSRPHFVLLIWILVGGIAASLGYFMFLPQDPFWFLYVALFALVSSGVYWFWKRRLDSVPAFWLVIGVSAILTIAAATQITEPFISQMWELRRPSLWLFCLLVSLGVNLIYGTVLHLIFGARRKAQR